MAEKLLTLENVRLTFSDALFQRQVFPGSGPESLAYSCNFLMPADHPAVADIKAALLEVSEERWPGEGREKLTERIAASKCCFKNGDTKPEYQDYAGSYFISARSAKRKPRTVGRNGEEVTETQGIIYAGCYVDGYVAIYISKGYGQRLCCSLRGVQFRADGEAFGGGSVASLDEFQDLGSPDEPNNADLIGTAAVDDIAF